MVVSNRANLTFYTNAGCIVRLSIPRARMDKTAEAARASMEAILDNGIVVTGVGSPSVVRGAELVQTQRAMMI